MIRKVIFRADGHSKMGLGHVFRSLAFADILKSNFDCIFAIKAPSPSLVYQIKSICNSIWILPEELDNELDEVEYMIEKYHIGEEIFILDGYHFRTDYQSRLKEKNCMVICVDDIYDYHFVADAIINHAGGLSPGCYSAEKYTKIYLGLKFALLRKEFREAAKNRVCSRKEKAMFICLGGADPKNDTLEVLKKCEQNGLIDKYYVIIGSAYEYKAELVKFIHTLDKEVILLSNIGPAEMVFYMKKCAWAITSPSTISYEYLSVGGELYLKVIADNQINIFRYFIEEGLAFSVDEFPVKDPSRLEKAIALQNQLLDGNSDKRLEDIVYAVSS